MDVHPHSLDEVIGTKPRNGTEVAADLARSPAFTAAIDRAVAESNKAATAPLPSACGMHSRESWLKGGSRNEARRVFESLDSQASRALRRSSNA